MLKLTAGGLILAALAVFAARPVYVIEGQVADERGEAARGVQVCAFPEGFDPKRPNVSIPCACADADGHFAVAVAGPGKYTQEPLEELRLPPMNPPRRPETMKDERRKMN
jgi:hypothetical protein